MSAFGLAKQLGVERGLAFENVGFAYEPEKPVLREVEPDRTENS